MALQSQNDGVASGQQQPSSTWGEFNNLMFVIQQALGKLSTSTLVRVEACTNNGALSPIGFVDITPLVNQMDGQSTPTPHTTIYNVPYFRLQGGTNAVIIDPVPGDIGMACFASRDITKIKSTRKQGNPGSMRQFSMADALYVGGMLNGAPTQYVQFSATGIKLHSPNAVILDAPDVQILADTVVINATTSTTVTTPEFIVNGTSVLNGPITQTGGGSAEFSGDLHMTGTLTSDEDVIANGTSLHSHHHGNVQSGSDNTGPPV